jgi:hypothetical protein
VLVPFPSLGDLTPRDRRILGPAMEAAGTAARGEGRPALNALFSALAAALSEPKPGPSVQIDALADLDEAELERQLDGMGRQRSREERDGHAARAAFFADASAALCAERTRRQDVLASMDAALTERGRRPPESN